MRSIKIPKHRMKCGTALGLQKMFHRSMNLEVTDVAKTGPMFKLLYLKK